MLIRDQHWAKIFLAYTYETYINALKYRTSISDSVKIRVDFIHWERHHKTRSWGWSQKLDCIFCWYLMLRYSVEFLLSYGLPYTNIYWEQLHPQQQNLRLEDHTPLLRWYALKILHIAHEMHNINHSAVITCKCVQTDCDDEYRCCIKEEVIDICCLGTVYIIWSSYPLK